MRGISAIIVTILLLMISVSLASFGYIFLTQVMSETTQAGTEAVEQMSTSLLAGMKIDSMTSNTIYIRNTGKVDLTNFAVYIDNALDSSISVDIDPLPPGGLATITSVSISSGNTVKVTSGEGAIAIKSFG